MLYPYEKYKMMKLTGPAGFRRYYSEPRRSSFGTLQRVLPGLAYSFHSLQAVRSFYNTLLRSANYLPSLMATSDVDLMAYS